jgi:16S rRNA (adenine1518-N6/adenine1519-N6)-dimethyltransferase
MTRARGRRGTGAPASRHRRRLGQHFLVDDRVAARIVGCAELDARPPVLEIGPGRGALTDHLRRATDRLCLVEVDRRLAQALRQRYADDGAVSVVEGDILEVDLAGLLVERVHVVGNLPYRIASQILLRLLEVRERCPLAVVTVQEEVARRLGARPGGHDYGVLSLLVQLYAEVERCFAIAPGSFAPPPRVGSVTVRLRLHPEPRVPVADTGVFRFLVRSLFQHRRKMVRTTMGDALEDLGLDRRASTAILEEAGVDPCARPEQITLERFAGLTGATVARMARRDGPRSGGAKADRR